MIKRKSSKQSEIIECLHKNNNDVMCICNISNNKMYDTNSIKAERGEIEIYYRKVLVLHVKWYNRI